MAYISALDPKVIGGIVSIGKRLVGYSSSTPDGAKYYAQDDIHINSSTNHYTSYHNTSEPISAVSNPSRPRTKMPRKYARYRRYYKRKYRARYRYPSSRTQNNYYPKMKRYMRGRFRIGGIYIGAKKYLDTYWISTQQIGSFGTGTIRTRELTAVPQGTAFSERIGRQIWITKLSVRLQLELESFDGTQANWLGTKRDDLLRILIVQDTQTNGTQFATTDLFAKSITSIGPPVVLANPSALQSMYNIANYKRFRVLYNRTVSLSRQGDDICVAGTNVSVQNKVFNYDFDLNWSKKPIIIEYSQGGTTGAIADHVSNSLWIMLITQNGQAFVADKSFMRVRYVDPNK